MKSEFNVKNKKIAIEHGKWLVTFAHTRAKIGIIKENGKYYFLKDLHGQEVKKELEGIVLLKWLFLEGENERKHFKILTSLAEYASAEAKKLADKARAEAPIMVDQMLECNGYLQFFSFLKEQ